MVYDELEEIRRRKLEELRKRLEEEQRKKLEEIEKVRRTIEEMESVVRKYLTKDSIDRLNNLKIAHKERYLQILTILYQNIVSGRLNRKLTDEEFKRILKKLVDLTRKKTKIKIIRT